MNLRDLVINNFTIPKHFNDIPLDLMHIFMERSQYILIDHYQYHPKNPFQAQGDASKAVGELTKYLKVFQSDQEAWQELCDLYIQEQDYNKVIFFLHF